MCNDLYCPRNTGYFTNIAYTKVSNTLCISGTGINNNCTLFTSYRVDVKRHINKNFTLLLGHDNDRIIHRLVNTKHGVDRKILQIFQLFPSCHTVEYAIKFLKIYNRMFQ